MVKPQQPELRRSDRGATSDDATKGRLSAPSTPAEGGAGGPVPDENLPGHHPDQEQDKPSGQAFVAKMHALAQDDADEAPAADDEVFDLTEVEQDGVHTGTDPKEPSGRGETLAKAAGKPFELAGSALSAVRKRLPGS